MKDTSIIPDFGDLWKPVVTWLPNGWAISICNLFPKLADRFLEMRAPNQRNVHKAALERLNSDVANRRFVMTHQGMAFDRAHKLTDGQHRCLSVSKSGESIEVLVFFGVGGVEEMSKTDLVDPRNTSDMARVLEADLPGAFLQTLRQYLKWHQSPKPKQKNFSHAEIVEKGLVLRAELAAVTEWFKGCHVKGADRAPVRAAVLSALLCGVADLTLVRFAGVVCDKIPATEAQDSAPQRLRHHLTKLGGAGGAGVDADIFLRTCCAIQNCVAERPVQLLKSLNENPFTSPIRELFKEAA